MKKKLFSVLLSVMFIISTFMAFTAMAADESGQVDASLSFSKTEYAANENIDVLLTVTNNSSAAVGNVQSVITLPEGLTLVSGNLTQTTETLAASESVENEIVMIKDVAIVPPSEEAPDSGDGAQMGLWLVLMVLSGAALVFYVVKNKMIKGSALLALVLCAALVGGMAPLSVNAAVDSKELSVSEDITVAGETVTVSAVVTYDVEVADEEEPVVQTEVISFVAGEGAEWIASDNAQIYLYDYENQVSYLGTKAEDSNTWTFEVPAGLTAINFYRCEAEFTVEAWNTWTDSVAVRDAETQNVYTASGNEAGSWNGEVEKFYVRGSFNGWEATDVMTQNDDGTWTLEMELEVGTYTFKIATADWQPQYPTEDATLEIEVAGVYVFNLDTVAGTYTVELKEDVVEPVPTPTYTVTVNNGSGSGEYEAGVTVTVKADAAAEGYYFAGWTVEGAELADATAEETTFVMPAAAVTVTATYEKEEVVERTEIITFVDGTSGGWIGDANANIYLYDYEAQVSYLGTMIDENTWTIKIPAGLTTINFYRCEAEFTTSAWNSWTSGVSVRDAATQNIYTATDSNVGLWNGEAAPEIAYYLKGDFNTWSTNNPMTQNADGTWSVEIELAAGTYGYKVNGSDGTWYPGGDNQTLVAEADGIYVFTYTVGQSLTVELKEAAVEPVPTYTVTVNNGTGTGEYEAGVTVTVKADVAAEGYHFAGWTVEGAELADATAEETTFVMPAAAVTVTATYEEDVVEVQTEIITFVDGAGWIGDADAVIYLYDYENEVKYLGTKVDSKTWTFEVPVGLTAINFQRWNPTETTMWNSWTTGVSVRDTATQNTYTATNDGGGNWNGEDNSAALYLRGSFNGWSTANKMTANADGTYSIEIYLTAQTTPYEYKIADADWNQPTYPSQNAVLNVDVDGTYVFVLNADKTITVSMK